MLVQHDTARASYDCPTFRICSVTQQGYRPILFFELSLMNL